MGNAAKRIPLNPYLHGEQGGGRPEVSGEGAGPDVERGGGEGFGYSEKEAVDDVEEEYGGSGSDGGWGVLHVGGEAEYSASEALVHGL